MSRHSFIGISTRGPYAGIGFSRRHGRRRTPARLVSSTNQVHAARLRAINTQERDAIATINARLANDLGAMKSRMTAFQLDETAVAARTDELLAALKAEIA